MVALFAVQRPTPQRDLFGAIPAGQSVRLVQMTEPELYAAKLAHGRTAPRHAIGLFGNSRAVMVGAADLGAASGAFFNYAVPGSSFRTSVALAEDLARIDKLPKVVLISLDHLEIQFDGNPNTRGVTAWLGRLWRDLTVSVGHSDITLRERLRAVWRHLYVAYGGLTRYFNAEQLAGDVEWRLKSGGVRRWWHGTPSPAATGYRRDGSRAVEAPASSPALAGLAPAAPAVLVGYLRADLRRLASLQRKGSRIIIYESPLQATTYERARRRPAGHAKALRAVLLQDCKHLGLECHGYARSASLAKADGWRDATHPPARGLANYLAALMARDPHKDLAGDGRAVPAR